VDSKKPQQGLSALQGSAVPPSLDGLAGPNGEPLSFESFVTELQREAPVESAEEEAVPQQEEEFMDAIDREHARFEREGAPIALDLQNER
jgi:hypothetical protein